MKFKKAPKTYWKHEKNVDAFLYIYSVSSDTGKEAKVNAAWMVQGVDAHWFASPIWTVHIKQDQYRHWHPYTPLGKLRHE